jgi:hypothetical protein
VQKEGMMEKHYFCTLFDSGYLIKGLAMIKSLALHCPKMHIYVLCMDRQTKHILEQLNISYVSCINLAEVENEELLAAKADRGVAEYCWTLSSNFTWYVMNSYAEINFLTYLDADLLFYSDVKPLFDEIGDASIAIIEHRFTERLKDREVNGRFCVEWVGFRRDEQGLACLSYWRQQCIDWCYYRLEDGKMGDQKYLDLWPEQYSACHILMDKGAGIAPWNYSQYSFDKDEIGRITVEESPLIFYHFHQFQLLENGEFDRLSSFYTSECPEPHAIYVHYESMLKNCLLDIRTIVPSFRDGMRPAKNIFFRRIIQNYVPAGIKNFARKYIRL